MNVAVTVLAALGAVLSLAFVVVYSRRRWWASNTGRILMATVATLAVLFALRVWGRVYPGVPDWIWAAGYGVLDAGLFGLLWLLLHGDKER